jgi:hypothetical protein
MPAACRVCRRRRDPSRVNRRCGSRFRSPSPDSRLRSPATPAAWRQAHPTGEHLGVGGTPAQSSPEPVTHLQRAGGDEARS